MADMMDTASDITESALEDQMRVIRHRGEINLRLASEIDANKNLVRECEDCGAEIPRARLLAVPTARRCASCQGEFESKKR